MRQLKFFLPLSTTKVAIAVAATTILAIAVPFVVHSVPSSDQLVRFGGETLPFLSKATYLGPGNPSQQISLSFYLKINTTAAEEYASSIYQPGSPNFHKFLTPQQYAAQFGPTNQSLNALRIG